MIIDHRTLTVFAVRNVVVGIVAAASTFMPLTATAEVGTDRLEQVRLQMEETQKKLSELQSSYDAQQNNIKKIQSAIKTLSDKEKSLKKDLTKVEASQRDSLRQLSEMQGQIQDIETLSLKRIRSLYIMGGEGSGLLEIRNQNSFDQASVYVSRIRRYDQDLVAMLQSLKGKRDAEAGKLTKLQRDQSDLLDKLTEQHEELTEKYDSQKDALQQLTSKRKELDGLLSSLKAQSLRLETVLKALTGGEQTGESNELAKQESSKSSAKLLGFDGPGLSNKSDLKPPLESAKVIQRFGKFKGSEGLGDGIRRGIELGSTVEKVTAVNAGRVAFVGKMPQIGTVVIVDHGKRDYSLYGRLSSAAVKVGDVLQGGDPIGRTSPPDDQGRTFYLEIRRGGNPVDPEEFFGKRLASK